MALWFQNCSEQKAACAADGQTCLATYSNCILNNQVRLWLLVGLFVGGCYYLANMDTKR